MSNELMLDEFRLWCRANKWKVKDAPVFVKIRRSEVEDETLTPPLYKASIDLKAEDIMASFTVWGTGDISVIIMDNHTAEELVVDDRHQQTPKDMHYILDHYTALILSQGPFLKPD